MAAQPADVTSGQSEVSLGPMAAGWQDGRTGLPAMGHALLYSLESLPFPASPTTPALGQHYPGAPRPRIPWPSGLGKHQGDLGGHLAESFLMP